MVRMLQLWHDVLQKSYTVKLSLILNINRYSENIFVTIELNLKLYTHNYTYKHGVKNKNDFSL